MRISSAESYGGSLLPFEGLARRQLPKAPNEAPGENNSGHGISIRGAVGGAGQTRMRGCSCWRSRGSVRLMVSVHDARCEAVMGASQHEHRAAVLVDPQRRQPALLPCLPLVDIHCTCGWFADAGDAVLLKILLCSIENNLDSLIVFRPDTSTSQKVPFSKHARTFMGIVKVLFPIPS